jgi:hypothetical protein
MAGTEIGVWGRLLKNAFRSNDGLQPFLREVIQQVMEAEAAEHVNAAPHERTEDRKGYRNGSKPRKLATRVGELELDVPQVRGCEPYHPSLFNKWQRSERALLAACGEMYFQGVSTRNVRQVLEAMCQGEISAMTVSRVAAELDQKLSEFRVRRLDQTAWPYLMIDARYEKVRVEGRVISRVRPFLFALCGGLEARPISFGLSTLVHRVQIHHGRRVIAVPFHSGPLEPQRQVLAHCLGRAGTDVPAVGQGLGVIQHLQTLHEVMPQRLQTLSFSGLGTHLFHQGINGRQHGLHPDFLELLEPLEGPGLGHFRVAQAADGRRMHVLGQVIKVQHQRLETQERRADLGHDPLGSIHQRDRFLRPVKTDLVRERLEQWPVIVALLLGGEHMPALLFLVVEYPDFHLLESLVGAGPRPG